MFEFGAKLSISLVDGMADVHRLSWEPYNEGKDLKEQIENYKQRYERYPEAVCADKIYRMVFLVMSLMVLARRKAKAFFVSLIAMIIEMIERLNFIPMERVSAA